MHRLSGEGGVGLATVTPLYEVIRFYFYSYVQDGSDVAIPAGSLNTNVTHLFSGNFL